MTFRTTTTAAVMAFITAVGLCLILLMGAASVNSPIRLRDEFSELGSIVLVSSTNPFLADSDDRSEVDGAVGLFKSALDELPQADSLYVGCENGRLVEHLPKRFTTSTWFGPSRTEQCRCGG